MKWKKLLDKLEDRKNTLSGFNSLMTIFRETESIQEELKEAVYHSQANGFCKKFQGQKKW
jgi:hypothetical protein